MNPCVISTLIIFAITSSIDKFISASDTKSTRSDDTNNPKGAKDLKSVTGSTPTKSPSGGNENKNKLITGGSGGKDAKAGSSSKDDSNNETTGVSTKSTDPSSTPGKVGPANSAETSIDEDENAIEKTKTIKEALEDHQYRVVTADNKQLLNAVPNDFTKFDITDLNDDLLSLQFKEPPKYVELRQGFTTLWTNKNHLGDDFLQMLEYRPKEKSANVHFNHPKEVEITTKGSPRVNDTTKYKVSKVHGEDGYEYNFNDGAKCTLLKHNDKEVWKYEISGTPTSGSTSTNTTSYPKSILFNKKYSTFAVKFESESSYYYLNSGGSWERLKAPDEIKVMIEGSATENDTTKYFLCRLGDGTYTYMFNKGAKCTGISHNGEEVLKHTGSSYPESITYNNKYTKVTLYLPGNNIKHFHKSGGTWAEKPSHMDLDLKKKETCYEFKYSKEGDNGVYTPKLNFKFKGVKVDSHVVWESKDDKVLGKKVVVGYRDDSPTHVSVMLQDSIKHVFLENNSWKEMSHLSILDIKGKGSTYMFKYSSDNGAKTGKYTSNLNFKFKQVKQGDKVIWETNDSKEHGKEVEVHGVGKNEKTLIILLASGKTIRFKKSGGCLGIGASWSQIQEEAITAKSTDNAADQSKKEENKHDKQIKEGEQSKGPGESNKSPGVVNSGESKGSSDIKDQIRTADTVDHKDETQGGSTPEAGSGPPPIPPSGPKIGKSAQQSENNISPPSSTHSTPAKPSTLTTPKTGSTPSTPINLSTQAQGSTPEAGSVPPPIPPAGPKIKTSQDYTPPNSANQTISIATASSLTAKSSIVSSNSITPMPKPFEGSTPTSGGGSTATPKTNLTEGAKTGTNNIELAKSGSQTPKPAAGQAATPTSRASTPAQGSTPSKAATPPHGTTQSGSAAQTAGRFSGPKPAAASNADDKSAVPAKPSGGSSAQSGGSTPSNANAKAATPVQTSTPNAGQGTPPKASAQSTPAKPAAPTSGGEPTPPTPKSAGRGTPTTPSAPSTQTSGGGSTPTAAGRGTGGPAPRQTAPGSATSTPQTAGGNGAGRGVAGSQSSGTQPQTGGVRAITVPSGSNQTGGSSATPKTNQTEGPKAGANASTHGSNSTTPRRGDPTKVSAPSRSVTSTKAPN